MRLDVSWTDGGTQVHRVEDWPDEWGVPRLGEGMNIKRDGAWLIGEIEDVTYFRETEEEGGEGYTVMVHIR
jgi:hypothetical protein